MIKVTIFASKAKQNNTLETLLLLTFFFYLD